MDLLFHGPGLDIEEDLDTPTIHELFVYYDGLYFGNSLGTCTVEWSPQKMTRCAGICYPQPGGGCILRLSEPLLRLRPSWELKNTLIHEMVHAWLITRGIREGNGGHGPKFVAKAREINMSRVSDFQRPARGYDITVYHTMHDEVRFYQQHHWKCNGCGKVICRAMNRKPQPADCRSYHRFRGSDCGDDNCGYHKHLKACPRGEFVKIKEPEGYVDKKQKRKVGEAEGDAKRRRSQPDASRSITDFFRGPGRTVGGTVQPLSDVEGEQPDAAAVDSGGEPMRERLAAAAAKRLASGPGDGSEPSSAGAVAKVTGFIMSPGPGPNSPEEKPRLKQRDLLSFLSPKSTRQRSPLGSGCSTEEAAAGVGPATTGPAAEEERRQQAVSNDDAGSPPAIAHSGGGILLESPPDMQASSSRAVDAPRTECPICGVMLLVVSNAELNRHIDACLGQSLTPDVIVL